MEHLEETSVLLYEELCSRVIDENDLITKATIRFRENLGLAKYCASKFSSPIDGSMDKDDIFQEAYLGLWIACLRYDESMGYDISAIAVPTINGTILNSLYHNESLKTPRTHKDIRAALYKYGFTLPLSEDEINTLLESKKFSRKQLMDYTYVNILSLDAATTEDGDSNLSNIIPDKNSYIPENLDEDELEAAIDHILLYIKPTHRDMVEEWIYATLAGEHIKPAAIGRKYGLSRAVTSLVMKSAIEMCRLHREEILKALGMQI